MESKLSVPSRTMRVLGLERRKEIETTRQRFELVILGSQVHGGGSVAHSPRCHDEKYTFLRRSEAC
jgi:hypothetical protein